MSKLSINTIQPEQACYAAQILKVIKERIKGVNYFFCTPICVYSRSLYAFMAFCIHSVTIFFSIFPSVFLRVTGQQLPSSEQSFLFTFQSITVIISLQHFSILFLRRQVVVVSTKSVVIAFNAALITLFRILSGPVTLLIGSFCIAFFIFFGKTIQLIFRGRGKSQLLMSCRSAWYIPRKNLSISIFVFSLLLFVYWPCSVQRSKSR